MVGRGDKATTKYQLLARTTLRLSIASAANVPGCRIAPARRVDNRFGVQVPVVVLRTFVPITMTAHLALRILDDKSSGCRSSFALTSDNYECLTSHFLLSTFSIYLTPVSLIAGARSFNPAALLRGNCLYNDKGISTLWTGHWLLVLDVTTLRTRACRCFLHIGAEKSESLRITGSTEIVATTYRTLKQPSKGRC